MQNRNIVTCVLRLLDATVYFSSLNKLLLTNIFLFPDIKISQHNEHCLKKNIIPNDTRDTNRNHVKIGVIYAILLNGIQSTSSNYPEKVCIFFSRYDLFHLMVLRSFWKRPSLHLDLFLKVFFGFLWKNFNLFKGKSGHLSRMFSPGRVC